MEEPKSIKISIAKYDEMFQSWVLETKTYIDIHTLTKASNKFDTYIGIVHDETDDDNYSDFTFKVVNGAKFMLAVIKYDLAL